MEVPSSSSSGRKGAAPAAKAIIPVEVAGGDHPTDAGETEQPEEGVSSRWEPQMDDETAAMWKKFMAGSRAMDVPMWDNRMVEDLPKVRLWAAAHLTHTQGSKGS